MNAQALKCLVSCDHPQVSFDKRHSGHIGLLYPGFKPGNGKIVCSLHVLPVGFVLGALVSPSADSHSRTVLILTLKKKSILQSNNCNSHAEHKTNGRRVV